MPIRLPNELYTRDQVRELDRISIEERGIPGISLMRRAASACLDHLCQRWPAAKRIVVCCGSGNNAGDGYILAALLADKAFDVSVLIVGQTQGLSADATQALSFCQSRQLTIEAWGIDDVLGPSETLSNADVIVDALLGTGIQGELRAHYLRAVDAINQLKIPVLSVDIPSGLNADTGQIMGAAVTADLTVTFIALKRGLFTLHGPDKSGVIVFADLGVPEDIYSQVAPSLDRLEYRNLIEQLAPRARHSHKHDFGHVLVVGGDKGMGGAVAMASEAALRSGAGLVSVVCHEHHGATLLARCPELMVQGVDADLSILDKMLERANVVILGPGLGQSDWSKRVYETVINYSSKCQESADTYFVIDADGLNCLADGFNYLSDGPNCLAESPIKNDRWILTPHPGEACRLLNNTMALNDRFAAVAALQQQFGGTVLLKGAGTIIQSANQTSLSDYGNPGMSSAGMGDVLSGVIGALLAQGCSPYFAAQLGAVVHSLAADKCVALNGERGLMATDLLPHIRSLLNDC